MRARDVAGFAATQLRRNKGRTALTTTGVIVGVFALTTIVALGNGLQIAIVSQLTDDESQTQVVVSAGFGQLPEGDLDEAVKDVADPAKADRLKKSIAKRRRGGPGGKKRKLLTQDAVEDFATRAHVKSVTPFVVDRFGLQLGEHEAEIALSFSVAPQPRWDARVLPGGEPFRDQRGVWLHEYLLFTWGYTSDEAQAALVGKEVVLTRPRVGQSMRAYLDLARASGVPLPEGVDEAQAAKLTETLAKRFGVATDDAPELELRLPILGVVRERLDGDGFEAFQDSFSMQSDLFLPQQLAEELFMQVPANRANGYNAVAVEVDRAEHVQELEKALRKEGYRTISVGTILERVGQALAILTSFVSALTAIALLVAVLGIVNTMVMNISERTREIGVLKALGATNRQVRSLFVCEAGLIGLSGGVVGVALSLLASIPGDAINRYVVRQTTQYDFPGSVFSFSPWLLLIAVSFAVALSVVAAWAPSRRASNVDPVEALRDE
ncbi:MAG: ABC transporter permease [Planctomycetes bacterium]|nr:ABC transporter permease [Planctomycetota bacterium]